MAQAIEISFYNGRSKNTSTVFTGHGESSMNKDAVWQFTAPAAKIKNLRILFSWNNSAAGTGFLGEFPFYFSVTKDGRTASSENASDYRLAANADTQRIGDAIIKNLNGSSGSVEVLFPKLSLIKGETYYIRVNAADEVYKSIKGFARAVEASYERAGNIYIYTGNGMRSASLVCFTAGAFAEGRLLKRTGGEWKEGIT